MKKPKAVALSAILAGLIGCSAEVSWNEACGCGPLWWLVATDLGLSAVGETSMNPDFIALATEESLTGRALTLGNVRAIGPSFEDACFRRGLVEIRCQFWMWYAEDQNRGVELRFINQEGLRIEVRGRYVYDVSG